MGTARLRVPKGIAGWWGAAAGLPGQSVPSWSQLMGYSFQTGTRAPRQSLCREGRVISSLGRAWDILSNINKQLGGDAEKRHHGPLVLTSKYHLILISNCDSHHLPLSPPPPRPRRDNAGAVPGITVLHWGKSTAFHLESDTLLGKGKITDHSKICEIMVKQAEVDLKGKRPISVILVIFFQNRVNVGVMGKVIQKLENAARCAIKYNIWNTEELYQTTQPIKQ